VDILIRSELAVVTASEYPAFDLSVCAVGSQPTPAGVLERSRITSLLLDASVRWGAVKFPV